ncbi:hypothetical protein [Laceyella putida]|uniref:Uncharacterized protein n=1 Tax=Laceyella putida TaxID=110101 RepID=A0ABW2RK53_9BACL
MHVLNKGLLAFTLLFSLSGCSMPWQEEKPVLEKTEPSLRPPTLVEVLELAETTLKRGEGWSFQLKSQEKLTLKQQQTGARFEAKVNVTIDPYALSSQGTILSKGKKKAEQLVIIGEKGYLKEGKGPWKTGTRVQMQTSIEDPTQALVELASVAKQKNAKLKMVESHGYTSVTAELAPGQNEGVLWSKARAELEPTLKQLKGLGIRVNPAKISLKSYKREVHIDPKTHVLHAVSTQFVFQLPTATGMIAYQQIQTAEVRGVFKGRITLPAELQPKAK